MNVYRPIRPKHWHPKRETYVIPPAEIRRALAGTPHPREWTCGLNCGLLFRFAHEGEIDPSQCWKTGTHFWMLCPAHPEFPICTIHTTAYAERADDD